MPNQESTEPEKRPLRLLLIDDEPAILASFSLAFGDQGWDVSTAPTGEEALERYSPGAYDVVITDKNLPGIGGVQIIKTIRSIDSEVTLMMLTGFGSPASAVDTLNAGVDAYIEKPVRDVIRLTARTEAILRNRTRKRAHEARAGSPPKATFSVLILSAIPSVSAAIAADFAEAADTVTTAATPSEARAPLDAGDVDLVVIEESFPDLCETIESLGKSHEDLPVAVMGQHLGLETLMRLVDAGIAACCVLPVGSGPCKEKLSALVFELHGAKVAASQEPASLRPVRPKT